MLRARLLLGLQLVVALVLPFVVYQLDPPSPVLWSIAVFVIVLIYVLINSHWTWFILGAVVVSSLPSVIDFGRESDPFMWGAAAMSLGVLVAVTMLQPVPEPPMFRPRGYSRRPLYLALPVIVIAIAAIVGFALLFNRSANLASQRGQAETADFFANAPTEPRGLDDGSSPVLASPTLPTSQPAEPGAVIASLEFRRANGRRVVSRDPLYVRDGADLPTLALGPGRYPNAADPGALGNFAIAGHCSSFSAPFADLGGLEVGDRIIATNLEGNASTYRVAQVETVTPDAMWTLNPDPLGSGTPTMTLTSCVADNSADQRTVVLAILETD
jgi:LPXTG-site transpeptidase (sortase) family protein